jgi:hypothetical protein
MACGGDLEMLGRNAIANGAADALSLEAIVTAIAMVEHRLPYVFVPALRG